MQFIPLQAIPSQTVTVTLSNQKVTLNIYAKTSLFDPQYDTTDKTIVFCDIYLNDALLLGGIPCWNANRLVRSAYLGFAGDLAFYDLAGASDPQYSGFGSRWVLIYFTSTDLTLVGLAA